MGPRPFTTHTRSRPIFIPYFPYDLTNRWNAQHNFSIHQSGFVYFALEQGAHLMGDGQNGVLRMGFKLRLRMAFLGATISSDAGLLVFAVLDVQLLNP